LSELSFEMSVLNAVNSNQFDEIDDLLININKNLDRELTEGKIQLQNCENLIKFKNTVITEEMLDKANAADDGSITIVDDVDDTLIDDDSDDVSMDKYFQGYEKNKTIDEIDKKVEIIDGDAPQKITTSNKQNDDALLTDDDSLHPTNINVSQDNEEAKYL
jgi:hypothetical protein